MDVIINQQFDKIMQMIEKMVLNIWHMHWAVKLFTLIIAALAPLSDLIHVILGLLFVDMVTSIYYQMIQVYDKAPKGKKRTAINIIESKKLRKTLEKMVFYVLILIVFFIFDIHILKLTALSTSDILAFSLTNISAGLICLVEVTSIASNVSKITSNPIFDKITKLLTKKVEEKYGINEDDTQPPIN